MTASPPLAHLPDLLRDEPALLDLLGGKAGVAVVPEAARAFVVAGLARLGGRRPVLVAVATAADAERIAHDLGQFLGADRVALFPAWETLPFERVSPQADTMGRRLEVMWRLREGGDRLPDVVVAPVRALVQRLGPHVEDVQPVTLVPGDVVDQAVLVERLAAAGYRREYQVEARGEFAVRGSIVDVFPSTDDHPVRIDLWGDEVDRLQTFGVADQRSTGDRPRVVIFPCREVLLTDDVRGRAAALGDAEPWGRDQWERLAAGALFDGMESWLPWLADGEHLLTDLVPEDGLVLLVEPARLRDRAQELLDDEEALAAALAQTWGVGADRDLPRLSLPFDRLLAHTRADALTVLGVPDRPETSQVESSVFAGVTGDAEVLAERMRGLVGDGVRVVIAADGEASAARLAEVLSDEGVPVTVQAGDTAVTPSATSVVVTVAPLERGFVLRGIGLAVIAEGDLTGRRRAHRAPRAPARPSDLNEDLAVGDYVVHRTHGVGRYEGMVTRTVGGVERDYLLLEYKKGDRLYVPTDQVDVVRRYTGGDQPTLHRLGGAEWERAKSRARSAVREIARELVELYRARATSRGRAFPEDTPWQREFEQAFPFEETPDQARAIADVKADMQRDVPMDRLVCGDVGFGKTEVALRAAFKAVQDGTQVAVLVPTTVLAAQHGDRFRERFANYPVRVEVLSRFLGPKEQREVVAGLSDGSVDVVIGTHRLLSDDIAFKNLGLLVVDEEQRFGVKHKERIKALRTDVDVLMLTATPIPRTLEMSITGIRDLSMIETPPAGRQPILTYVGEYDERAVAEAIRRELLRDGQVFVVHNRVYDIDEVAARVRDLVPEARVAIAHGQMDEGTLEQVVFDFWEQRYDVLVCTTIIESGVDMPTVNTLVVDRADLLGLSQMYQLRGRVGRAGQRAYAYLLVPRDRRLSEEAYERLKTIGETTALGSGFRIAMRDLEMRGAGNLLGEAQSGHIAAVGFDLYCELVTEAVAEMKGEPLPVPVEITIDIPLDAHLPRDYVARDDVRMEAYRRLAAVTDPGDVEDVRGEWEDRFGPPPEPAAALLEVARVRAELVRVGVTDFRLKDGVARFGPLPLKESQRVRLDRLAPGSTVKQREDGAGLDLVVSLARPARGGLRPGRDGGAEAVLEQMEAARALLQQLVPPEGAPVRSAAS
jgi:transcription-repair coupling factor (superfamily II helicase)